MNLKQLTLVPVFIALLSCSSQDAINSGTASLSFEQNAQGHFFIILNERINGQMEKQYVQTTPLEIQIMDANEGPYWLTGTYSNIDYKNGKVYCTGNITDNGREFAFVDIYSKFDEEGSFELERNVIVKTDVNSDQGFASRFGLQSVNSDSILENDFFAPGVWYQDNNHVRKGGLASDYRDNDFFFRETRLAAPIIMTTEKASGRTLTIAHLEPNPNTYVGEYRSRQEIDSRIGFGSLGVHKNPRPTLSFLYPGSEGQKTYIRNRGEKPQEWAYRHHPIIPNFSHSYKVLIKFGRFQDFYDAMKSNWQYFYNYYNPEIRTANVSKVYKDGIDLLDKYCRNYNGTWGIPFAVNLDGSIRDTDFYMAFVGGQLLSAYHLINYGLENDNPEIISKGDSVINFWVENSYNGTVGPNKLPNTWYQPVKHARFKGGIWENEKFWRPYPSYLRVLGEGHLAVLKTVRVLKEHGVEKERWMNWITRFGEWLCANQNEDGSFYRSFEVDGKPIETTKFNTTHAIPFLVQLYQLTTDKKYLKAAIDAGEYAWEEIHLTGAYVGGTPDNPDVMDKEAALLAMDAFMELYEFTKEHKWLIAMEKAAVFAETWNYIWDIPMAAGDTSHLEFDRINTSGLSLVSTGHSYSDYYNAFYPYQYFKLYQYTGDEHYYDVANLLLHNTKQLTDTDGTLGYGHPGLQTEGVVLDGNRGSGANVWLPWVTLAQIDPLVKIQKEFGAMDFKEIRQKGTLSNSQ